MFSSPHLDLHLHQQHRQLPSALFHIVFCPLPHLLLLLFFLCHILHANRIFLNFNWIFDWLYLCLYTHNSLPAYRPLDIVVSIVFVRLPPCLWLFSLFFLFFFAVG